MRGTYEVAKRAADLAVGQGPVEKDIKDFVVATLDHCADIGSRVVERGGAARGMAQLVSLGFAVYRAMFQICEKRLSAVACVVWSRIVVPYASFLTVTTATSQPPPRLVFQRHPHQSKSGPTPLTTPRMAKSTLAWVGGKSDNAKTTNEAVRPREKQRPDSYRCQRDALGIKKYHPLEHPWRAGASLRRGTQRGGRV
jgi:hypothetical protein